MTDDPEAIQRQIAALQQQLAALQAAIPAGDTALGNPAIGTVDNAGTLHGIAVGVNTGSISGTHSDNESKQ